MRKSTTEEKFNSWVERKHLEQSKCLDQYRKTFYELFNKVHSYHWLFKTFIEFETYNVNKSILTRTKRLVEHNKKSNLTLYSYLLRFGKDIAIEKWNRYKNRQAHAGVSLDYFIQKYGEEQGRLKYEEVNQKKSLTLENFTKNYGEKEGLKRWDSYRAKQAHAGNTLEYFIEKYGEEQGRLKYEEVNQKKRLTLEIFINKYGEKEGASRFFAFWENLGKVRAIGVSKSSQELFSSLDLVNEEKTYYHEKNKEFNVYCNVSKNEHMYFYDFVDTASKKVIEYNGDYWHRNPSSHPASEENKSIWEKDKRKIDFLRKRGYEVLIIWESEYLFNKQQTIEKCNEFLRN